MSPEAEKADEEKRSVQAFWNAAPCGTPDVLSEPEHRKYQELERIRDDREPFIHTFAEFAAQRGKKILEVGCGAGTDLLKFARAGANCTAVDLTDAGIATTSSRLLKEGLTADLRKADAEALPFEDGAFDFVYSWGVIHHTPNTPKAAQEILRVLRPGGKFCVMIYNRHSLLAVQAWLYFAAIRGNLGRSLADVLSSHVESPGTKAYTVEEARALFGGAIDVRIDTLVTPYDMRVGRRAFLPSWTHKLVPNRLGWFHVVRGVKP